MGSRIHDERSSVVPEIEPSRLAARAGRRAWGKAALTFPLVGKLVDHV